jgi:hypothetical protein
MFASWKKAKAQAEAEAAVGMVIKSLTHRLMQQPDAQLDDRFWENNYFMGFLFGLAGCCGIKHLDRPLTGDEGIEIFTKVLLTLTRSIWSVEQARATIVKNFLTCKKDPQAIKSDENVLAFKKGWEQAKVFFALVIGIKGYAENDETVIAAKQMDAAMNRMLGEANSSIGSAGYLQLTIKAEYERCYGKIEFA